MPTRKITFSDAEYYHVYNRGSGKQTIFHDIQDIRYFQSLLYIMNKKDRTKLANIKNIYTNNKVNKGETPLISMGAYCLMPNHFHLLLKQEQKNGISAFIQKISTGYVMYYNKKYSHAGTLFEGRFKAKHANTDRYLKYLFAYIHLNPLKIINQKWKESKKLNTKKYKIFLGGYTGSSYLDYIGEKRNENSILKRGVFPNYFSTKEKFWKDINFWISFSE